MSTPSNSSSVMVPIAEMYVGCSYPMRGDAIAASDTCRSHASSAVVDPASGAAYYRCSIHEGLLKDRIRGKVVISLPKRNH